MDVVVHDLRSAIDPAAAAVDRSGVGRSRDDIVDLVERDVLINVAVLDAESLAVIDQIVRDGTARPHEEDSGPPRDVAHYVVDRIASGHDHVRGVAGLVGEADAVDDIGEVAVGDAGLEPRHAGAVQGRGAAVEPDIDRMRVGFERETCCVRHGEVSEDHIRRAIGSDAGP